MNVKRRIPNRPMSLRRAAQIVLLTISGLLPAQTMLAQADDQPITADNVAEVVRSRIDQANLLDLQIGGVSQMITGQVLGGSEDGLVGMLITKTGRMVMMLDPIAEGNSSGETRGLFIDGATKNRSEAELTFEADSQDLIRFSGTIHGYDGADSTRVDVTLPMAAMTQGDATIEIEGDRFILTGTLGFSTYELMQKSIADHPEIRILELREAPGSVDDDVNVYTARLVRAAGLTTYVTKGSEIASGAVDLFAAGTTRIVEEGAILGVHSWCCSEDGTPAADLPRDAPEHASQLAYFSEMLGPEHGPAFYFFTLNAAPAEDIKPMTSEELLSFGLATEIR